MQTETFDGNSLGGRLTARFIRRFVAPSFSRSEDPAKQRGVLERLAKLSRVPRGLQVEKTTLAGRPAERLSPKTPRKPHKVVLYLHGGGYVAGSCNTHRELAGRIAKASGATVFLPEYRLTPEHPYPAGNEDCLAFFRALVEGGTAPERLFIGGDSAGGFFTLATLLALRDAGEAQPAGAFLISPAADLVYFEGDSILEKAPVDPWFDEQDIPFHASRFLAGATPPSEQACLFRADFSGLAPLLIQVGGREVLLSDSERVAQRADEAGVSVRFQLWPSQWHVFQSFAVLVPEGREAIREIGQFVNSCNGD